MTNVILGILLDCFCCVSVSVCDPGNYGTVSLANGLGKVAEMILCGCLDKSDPLRKST